MDISIIIVSWNVRDYLKECLESIQNTVKVAKFEIFVIDNNSGDGTVEFIKKSFPQVNLIANKDNPGFAKANNQAIVKGGGRYVVLLNPDTVVLPDSIDKMLKFMNANKEFGAIGPKIFAKDMHTTSSCAAREFPHILTLFFRLIKPDVWSRHFVHFSEINSRETDSLSGSCMMVRREAIDEVGMLDENFFMYAEDIDWCYRIKKGGWKIFYLAAAAIVHYGERSAVKKFSETENMTENFKAYFKYFKKHYGVLYALCYRLMLVLVIVGWNLFWIVSLFSRSVRSREKIMQIIVRNNRFIWWGVSIGDVN